MQAGLVSVPQPRHTLPWLCSYLTFFHSLAFALNVTRTEKPPLAISLSSVSPPEASDRLRGHEGRGWLWEAGFTVAPTVPPPSFHALVWFSPLQCHLNLVTWFESMEYGKGGRMPLLSLSYERLWTSPCWRTLLQSWLTHSDQARFQIRDLRGVELRAASSQHTSRNLGRQCTCSTHWGPGTEFRGRSFPGRAFRGDHRSGLAQDCGLVRGCEAEDPVKPCMISDLQKRCVVQAAKFWDKLLHNNR